MCLTKVGGKRKATKDIVCYKVLIETYNGNGEKLCCSPYNKFYWEIGKEYKNEEIANNYGSKEEIFSGYFHTFEKINECETKARKLIRSCRQNEALVMYECVIPKGTYYYYGYHQDGFWGYASKKLKITRRLGQYG